MNGSSGQVGMKLRPVSHPLTRLFERFFAIGIRGMFGSVLAGWWCFGTVGE